MESPDDYLEGSPLDRLVYLALIFAALRVMLTRGVNFVEIMSANRWLFLFFLYWGTSILWSEHPFVGFKRWTKDLGNVLMVLVILSERDPMEAAKSVFIKFSYLVVPLSVLLIKYYPDTGRTYNQWTWEYMYVGAAVHKNSLGCLALVSGLFLLWDFFDVRFNRAPRSTSDWLLKLGLLLMCAWLLYIANSATSLACAVIGAALLLGLRRPLFRVYDGECHRDRERARPRLRWRYRSSFRRATRRP